MKRALTRIPDWGWLALLAGALRLVNLGQENLWYDETFTAWVSGRLSWSQMWAALPGDTHPPLWYIVEFFNIRLLGSSEFALRVPDLLFGIVAVILVWKLAQVIHFERRTAFISGLLAAISPAAIYYSQDARMYPMLAIFVLLATIAAIKDRWLLFAVAAIGAIYSQNLGVVYVFCLGLISLVWRVRFVHRWHWAFIWPGLKELRRMLAALAVVVVAWLPWAGVVVHQARNMTQAFWMQPLSAIGVLWPFANMTMGWRLAEVFQLHLYGAALGLTVISIIVCRRWLKLRSGLLLLSVVFGMPALVALISWLWRSIYLPRAMLPSAMALSLLWAYGLEHLSIPNRRVARLIMIPCLLIALLSHYFPAADARVDTRGWLAPVREQWQAGDVAYYTAIHWSILAGYYLPGRDYAIRPYVSDLNQSLSEETKAAMGFNEAQFDDLAGMGYRRAWLLVYTNPMSRNDEYQEIDRIVTQYHAQLIREKRNDYAAELIYLVNLQ